MAITYYHVSSQLANRADAGSTAVNDDGFMIPVPATGGVVVVLDPRFWSIRNTGKTNAGADSTKAVFMAHGTTMATIDYAANTAAKRAQWPIDSGSDEIVPVRNGEHAQAIALLADTDTVCVAIRPNTPNSRGP